MNLERPRHYTLTRRNNRGGHGGSYVWESSDYFDTGEDEIAYSVSFEFEGNATTITYFPEREGVKLTANDEPGYEEGKKRAALGLALIKVVRSGGRFMKEL